MSGRTCRVVAACAIAGAGFAWVPAARADAGLTLSAPYASDDQGAGCYPDKGTCSADAHADPTSGATSIDVSNTAPATGTASNAYGQGGAEVTASFDLAQSAPALDVQVDINVSSAQAGHSGAGPAPSSSAFVFAYLNAYDSACGCFAYTFGNILSVSGTGSQSASGDYPVTLELTNFRGGDVSAGTVTVSGGIAGYEAMGQGDMGTESAAASATVVSFTAKPVVVTQTGSQTKPYVGIGGDIITSEPLPAGPTGDCTATGVSTGGTCFALDGTSQGASFTINDDQSINPIAGAYRFIDSFGDDLGDGTFCGSSGVVDVPRGATSAITWTFTAYSLFQCSQPSAATTGTITADQYSFS